MLLGRSRTHADAEEVVAVILRTLPPPAMYFIDVLARIALSPGSDMDPAALATNTG